MRLASTRLCRTLLVASLGLCATASLHELRYPRSYLRLQRQSDFNVYFVASQLVRHHLSSVLYSGAGNGVDPQRADAADTTPMATVAHRDGLGHIKLYVYPPLLADALLPLSSLRLPVAAACWRLLSLLVLFIGTLALTRLLAVRGWRAAAVVVAILCFSPLWQSLHYGQVTVPLFALWSAAILAYVEGWRRTSAALLGVGVVLKLTPLLVVVPLLVWRDGRGLRWLAGAIVTGLLLVCGINGPGVVWTYFAHVVPPMSAGLAASDNLTVLSALRMAALHTVGAVPTYLGLAGKALCLGLAAGAAAMSAPRRAADQGSLGQGFVLAAFALLSLCLSPVSWIDALLIGTPLLALLWRRMLLGGRSVGELLLLSLATADIGMSLLWQWAPGTSLPVLLLQYSPLVTALGLVFYGIHAGRQMGIADKAFDRSALPRAA